MDYHHQLSLFDIGDRDQLRTLAVFGSVFADVAKGAWYEQGIAWAAEAGIVSGYGGGRFGPNAEAYHAELFTSLKGLV